MPTCYLKISFDIRLEIVGFVSGRGVNNIFNFIYSVPFELLESLIIFWNLRTVTIFYVEGVSSVNLRINKGSG